MAIAGNTTDMKTVSGIRNRVPYRTLRKDNVLQWNTACRSIHLLCRYLTRESSAGNIIRSVLHPWLGKYRLWSLALNSRESEVSRLSVKPRAQVLVGRSRRCDVRLEDTGVSSIHCRFHQDRYGMLCVSDLGSLNGTTVNGSGLSAFETTGLSVGDSIGVGEHLFTVSDSVVHQNSPDTPDFFLSVEPGSERDDTEDQAVVRIVAGKEMRPFVFYTGLSVLLDFALNYFGISTQAMRFDTIHRDIQRQIVRQFFKSLSSAAASKWSLNLEMELAADFIPVGSDSSIRLNGMIQIADCSIRFCAGVLLAESFDFLVRMADRIPSDVLRYPPERFLHASLTPVVCAGTIPLDVTELETLACGDVMMLQRPGRYEGDSVVFRQAVIILNGNTGVTVDIRCRSILKNGEVYLEIRDNPLKEDTRMKEHQCESDAVQSSAVDAICRTRILDVSRVQMTEVRVEIGRLDMTVGELMELAPGMLLPMHRKPDDPVSIWSGKRAIARGRLVMVDDELGVELTEVLED